MQDIWSTAQITFSQNSAEFLLHFHFLFEYAECQIHTDNLDELFCLLFSVKDDSTRESLFSYFRYWVALHGAFKSYPNREKTATAA